MMIEETLMIKRVRIKVAKQIFEDLETLEETCISALCCLGNEEFEELKKKWTSRYYNKAK